MAKCIVMKLNETVDNPELIGINEMKLRFFKRSDEPVAVPVALSNNTSVVYNLKMIGDGHFTDSSGTADLGTDIDVTNGANTVYITNDDAELIIGDKHKLGVLSVNVGVTKIGEGFVIDTEDIKYAEKMSTLVIIAGGLRGKLSDLSNMSILGFLSIPSIYRTNMLTGSINDLSGSPNLSYFAASYQTGITGDIADFAQFPITYISILGTQISGDISALADKKNLRYISGTSTMDFSYSDPTPRASDAYIMALNEINLNDDVDNYLIANAGCTKHPDINSIALWGTRTSASDSALAAIKSKGITVTLNREEL